MAKKKFTDDQLSAINTRDKSLLVSAAAGSGKTATLTERIIRSITNKENPDDISRMLIVTFTNAAVAELRERITAAIKDALLLDPENKKLEHQLYMLPSARISTIDSFCNEILKNNTERFGISPRYRIADPIEARILEHAVWSSMIAAAFEGDIPEINALDFEELSCALTGVKNDGMLEESFEFLYDKAKSHTRGIKVFSEFAERISAALSLPLEEISYVDYAMTRTRKMAEHYKAILESLIGEACHGGDPRASAERARRIRDERAAIKRDYKGKEQKSLLADLPSLSAEELYLITMLDDFSILTSILDSKKYSEMRDAISVQFGDIERVSSSDKTETMIAFQTVRSSIKDEVTGYAKRYFSFTEEDWREHISDLARLIKVASVFIEKFDTVYFGEKKKRAMLEYSDIERLTYESLYNEDGTLSDLALSLREQFSSVYIDEYQDVNALQDMIFSAVSRSNNRFTVGDIKQSIYGFRSARPDIFTDMKNSYPKLESSDGSDTASIFMSKNFRCDEGIINFVNEIFDEMFTLTKDSIGYVSDDRLEFQKIYDDCPTPPVRVPEVTLIADGDARALAEDDGIDKSAVLPLWVAQKIKELVGNAKLNSGKPVSPKDIAVILRKDGGRSAVYKEAIESVGISARAPEGKDFFLNSEIQLAMCLLNTINNPGKDIYLAGLMLSPLYGFTPDELYRARRLGGLTLWDSVKRLAGAEPENAKLPEFINSIDKYRLIAEGMKVDALILRLYNETGLLALGLGSGCKENLMLLYNYARRFEASSYEGLYSFINYLNTVIDSDAKFSSDKEGEAEDAVTIMTVHKSKGLEFPIVILADAATSLISQNERSARIAYSEEMGMGMKTRIKDGLALISSPIHNVIIDKNIEKSFEEELRVYYVALTRAREQLFVAGAVRTKSKEDYEAAAEIRKRFKSPYILYQLNTFVDILYATDTSAKIEWIESKEGMDADEEVEEFDTHPILDEKIEKKAPDAERDSYEDIYDELIERFSFSYKSPHLTTLPEKMSISTIYPTVLDGNDEEERLSLDAKPQREVKRGRLPEFITGERSDESARRGIATHNFLQFFDLEGFFRSTDEEELSRLINERFISEENAKRVRMSEIALFRTSTLYSEMRKAKNIWREFRFSVLLPATLFTENEEKKVAYKDRTILLQGVMDCIYEDEEGNLHLVDYKTDRLTKDELCDRSLAEAKLRAKHSLQLNYYALAIKSIFGKEPVTKRVYSLPLGDTIEV